MIFLTVGTQLPFDRLVRAMEVIAPSLDEPVLAQIGRGGYRPANMEWVETIPPQDFEETFYRASRIVSHAGIGTILTARRLGKPLIVFPRRLEFGEHRNNHQVGTVGHLDRMPGVHVAVDETALSQLVRAEDLRSEGIADLRSGRQSLIDFIRSQIGSRYRQGSVHCVSSSSSPPQT